LDVKPRLSQNKETAITLFEVIVVIVVVIFLALLVLAIPCHPYSKHAAQKLSCMSNLKQVGMSYGVWAGDNHDTFPMLVSVTNGGAMEMTEIGNAVPPFQVMSNELSTTKILWCPADGDRIWATNFSAVTSSNLSYFVGVDVTNGDNSNLILCGYCNLETGSIVDSRSVKPGLVSVTTNDLVTWQTSRHIKCGNLVLADGSVQATTRLGLRSYVAGTGLATNRWAIP